MTSIQVKDLNVEKLKSIRTELNKKYELELDDFGRPTRLNVGQEDLKYLLTALNSLKDKLPEISQELVDFTKDLFKALRNCMVLNEENQNFFANHENALTNVKSVLCALIENTDSKNWLLCIKIIYQFLINLVVGNGNSALKVWTSFENIFTDLCKKCDPYYTSALLYNILMRHPKLVLNNEVYASILNLFEDGKENEYIIFLIELFLKEDHMCDEYGTLKLTHRIILLEMLKQRLIIKRDEMFYISEKQVTALASEFKRKSDCILKTISDYVNNIDAREVALLLEILASLSSQETYLLCLQKDKSLLINCTYLLKSIHEVGIQGDNQFTPIQKLADLNSTKVEGCESAFGFKADLIRLMGNMCWKHKENQDSVREMEGILLVLECCNIDTKNPFIIQWSILAIRNLCEKNLENQKVIASLKQEGFVDSAVLQELGITLHDDGENTLGIVSWDELKKQIK